MNTATTIKLFLVNGHADGLRTAEISNWSGKAIAGPRSDLNTLRNRSELETPGIYFLIGEDEDSGRTRIYIGEAENVSHRLGSKNHAGKEFWISAIGFVSKDNNLTKAHIKYLEGAIIERAKELGLVIHNEQSSGASLPESDAADMEQYLSKVYQLLPVLGLNIFDVPETVSPDADDWLYCRIKGLEAKGRRTPGGFLVAAGSQAVKANRPSARNSARKRDLLVEQGVLVADGERYIFPKDHEFSSPSAAAVAIKGGATNGLVAWKNSKGTSLKELEITE